MGKSMAYLCNPSTFELESMYYGCKWNPNQKTLTFEKFSLSSIAGLYIAFVEPNISEGFFSEPVYPFSYVSDALITTLKDIYPEKDEDNLKKNPLNQALQGYFDYTNKCLNWLYKTTAGQTILDKILNSRHYVLITPGNNGNNYTSGTNPPMLKFVASRILRPEVQITENDQQALLDVLQQASEKTDRDEQFTWLANQINAVPLYSLFQQKPYEYTGTGFLNDEWDGGQTRPTADQLKDWFIPPLDSVCFLESPTNQEKKVKGVCLVDFVRFATILVLYNSSPNGTGSNTSIRFDININDMTALRPPAVGLGHELVHAYYSISGMQPGVEVFHYSTTLAEFLCVGLGPWENNPVSENAIRRQWIPSNLGEGIEKYEYDNKIVGPRNAYEEIDDQEEIPKTRGGRFI